MEKITTSTNMFLSIVLVSLLGCMYFLTTGSNFFQSFSYKGMYYITDNEEDPVINYKEITYWPSYSDTLLAKRVKKMALTVNNFSVQKKSAHYEKITPLFSPQGVESFKKRFDSMINKYADKGVYIVEFNMQELDPVLLSKIKFNELDVYNFYVEGIYKLRSLDENKNINVRASMVFVLVNSKSVKNNGITIDTIVFNSII
jgi:hypothetical protein